MPSLPGPIASPPDQPVRVFFPCTGLGRQRRGFETFTFECATVLQGDSRLAVTVFAGGPVGGLNARVLPNLPRDSHLARLVGTVLGRGGYFWEQATFFLFFLPHLLRGSPDVVYFADLNFGNLCWHWRRFTGQRYRLLFYNGGLTTKPFTRADVIQQLTPEGLAEATARGEDETRQVVLPHGVRVPDALPTRITGEARTALGLPADRPVVLSVGMLDRETKRMDYLIREIATLPAPRPFLCLLGAESAETPALRAQATALLGEDEVMLRTVAPELVSEYYRAADLFALASLREGFGLAYVEALAHGLPVIAHDSPVTRYLLDGFAALADLGAPGTLAHFVRSALATPPDEALRRAAHASVRARFGWDVLREQYVSLLLRAAAAPIP